MTPFDLETILDIPEDQDREYKLAGGGLPRSLWESYSGMANSNGGHIILGVEEREGAFTVTGISDPSRMKKDFWDTIHNPNKVNVNLLTDKDLHEAVVDGKTVLIITIPRATRRQRPVFINNNLFGGTFRRNFEGDYLCKPDEIKRMLTDQAEESPDSRTFEGFTLDDLDVESLKQYRNRFSSFFPQHPWLNLGDTQGNRTKSCKAFSNLGKVVEAN